LKIDSVVISFATRAADHREPNVKKGGRAFGVVVPTFTVITCETAVGSFDLVVPSADQPLVEGFLRSRHAAQVDGAARLSPPDVHGAPVTVVEEKLTALVNLSLFAQAERAYRLPGAGSRSLLYVFDGRQIGAHVVTADGRDLVPGSEHKGVLLTFWTDEARILVVQGISFEVWYGGVVGEGKVQSVGWPSGPTA